jgi:hypothetical protein
MRFISKVPDCFFLKRSNVESSWSGANRKPLSEPPHNIEALTMEYCFLSGKELLHTIPSRVRPRLSQLKLNNILGLSQDDMLMFLSHTAPTLQTLDLSFCSFDWPRGERPCYFIDRVVPLCISLQNMTIKICDHIVTVASLRLKPTRIEGSRMMYDNIGEPCDYDQIVEALEGTKWEKVWLRTNSMGPYTEAERIARERGIVLYLD